MVVDVILPAVLSPIDGISTQCHCRKLYEHELVLIGESGIEALEQQISQWGRYNGRKAPWSFQCSCLKLQRLLPGRMGEDGSLPAAVHISILHAKAFRVGGRTCNELEGLSHELVLVVCHFGLVTSERKDLLSCPRTDYVYTCG